MAAAAAGAAVEVVTAATRVDAATAVVAAAVSVALVVVVAAAAAVAVVVYPLNQIEIRQLQKDHHSEIVCCFSHLLALTTSNNQSLNVRNFASPPLPIASATALIMATFCKLLFD